LENTGKRWWFEAGNLLSAKCLNRKDFNAKGAKKFREVRKEIFVSGFEIISLLEDLLLFLAQLLSVVCSFLRLWQGIFANFAEFLCALRG
jgi:hypothetical protein